MVALKRRIDTTIGRVLAYGSLFGVVVSLVTAVFTAGAQATKIRAELDGKVSAIAFDTVKRKVDALWIFACRAAENRYDSQCAGAPK